MTSSFLSLENLGLSTHRRIVWGGGGDEHTVVSHFQYEAAIAAVSIAFFRATVRIQSNRHHQQPTDHRSSGEPRALTWFFTILLAGLAFYKKNSYELIAAVELFSYTVPWLLAMRFTRKDTDFLSSTRSAKTARAVDHDENKISSLRRLLRHGDFFIRLLLIALSAFLSLVLAHVIANGTLWHLLVKRLLPHRLVRGLRSILDRLFPITELEAAYAVLAQFAMSTRSLNQQVYHLLFVTFHIQVGMGFLGIDFLRKEQDRRNQLVRMDVRGMTQEEEDNQQKTDDESNEPQNRQSAASNPAEAIHQQEKQQQQPNGFMAAKPDCKPKESTAVSSSINTAARSALLLQRAHRFQRGAAPFIVFAALPYMFQIILFGNINNFAFTCVQDDMHRMVRLHQLFDHDNHLTAVARSQADSATSPGQYANSISNVVQTAYEMANRKLFSLPKILLLPAVISQQPMLVVQVFPFIFLSDYVKATAVSYMTTQIESLQKEIQELTAIRMKVEAFDIKNAELLQRSGAGSTQFTQRRWEELTVQVQDRKALSDLLARSKGFFSFIQRNFVFSVLIDCALANLIAVGRIAAADTFVFSRAIEDAVDLLLMRSRSEAELARMMTDIEKLNKLAGMWSNARQERLLLPCSLQPAASLATTTTTTETGSSAAKLSSPEHLNRMVFRNLQYNRGTASVRVDHMELKAGIYALTGANGSGT